MIILGISGIFSEVSDNAAAALLIDGKIVGACEEERFTRIKHGGGRVPEMAMRFLLNSNGLSLGDVDILTYYVDSWAGFHDELTLFLKNQFHTLPRKILATNHHTPIHHI